MGWVGLGLEIRWGYGTGTGTGTRTGKKRILGGIVTGIEGMRIWVGQLAMGFCFLLFYLFILMVVMDGRLVSVFVFSNVQLGCSFFGILSRVGVCVFN